MATDTAPPPAPEAPPPQPARRRRALQSGSLVWGTLAAILILATVLRLVGLDWDEGQHLHPDERFLTQVEAGLRWPESDFLRVYLDEAKSTLNPRNVGFTFFAYGSFPITLVKGVAVALDRDGYGEVYLVGRVIAALVDLGTLLALFFLARTLYRDDRIALLAAAFYACAALAIQQAHFFVVDNFSAFFAILALLFTARVVAHGRPRDYALAGAFVGMALASKLSVYPLALLPVTAAGYRVVVGWRTPGADRAAAFERTAFRLILCGVTAALVFRVCEPYAFAGLGLAPRWLANALEAREWVTGVRDAPFGHQWTGRTPLLFPLGNMIRWGLGVPLGLAAWAGWAAAGWQLVRRGAVAHLVPVAWTGIFFALLGTGWVTSLRYFLPIYPTLVLLAAWGLVRLHDWAVARRAALPPRPGRVAVIASRALLGVVLAATLAYAVGFAAIYTRPNTRVAASRWIYANLPPGTVIANETAYDDALPLRVDGKDGYGGIYRGLSLQLTDEDTPEKLRRMLGVLDQSEYIVISSNRQYGSLPRIPTRFPLVIRYYDLLFSGQLGFERIGDYTSHPSILGIPLPDQGAEEAWTVYDHPRVQIFRKAADYDGARVAALLDTIDWDKIVVLPAKTAAQAPNALRLTPAERAANTQGGTWRAIFDPGDLANRAPVPIWALALLLLGLVGLPYAWIAAAALPDRGYALARPLGMLLVGWLAWWFASARLLDFGRAGIAAAIAAAGVCGWALLIPRRGAFAAWLRDNRRLLLIEEAVFWGGFAAVLAIRWANPDLWHPARGGEKPMDFAFLNAVIKSTTFPPYDPWFADGTLNYYYFGYVLVAAVVELTGVVPAVAYNLAIPSLFAMLALAAFGGALALASRAVGGITARRAAAFGLVGACFVAVCGNLRELALILQGFRDLGRADLRSPIPGLIAAIETGRGFLLALTQNQALPIRPEWWFWNATRVIAHPPTESGPITEFPAFTFLFADLHAHLIALPFAAATIGLALAGALVPAASPGRAASWLRLGLLALLVGGLRAINTWDFPTYALIGLAAVGLEVWRRGDRERSERALAIAGRGGLFLALGYALYLPYHQRYGLVPLVPQLWQGSRTTLGAYLTIHGLFLAIIAAALLADLALSRDVHPVARLARLAARYPRRVRRARRLHARLVAGTPAYRAARRAALGILALVVLLALARQAVPALILALLGLTALALARRGDPGAPTAWQLALGFVALGLMLTLAVEFVVPRGLDVGRMNTVYKIYLQVWLLWGLAAAAAAARLYGQLPGRPRWFRGWHYGFVALVAATLLYPIFAVPARIADRMDPAAPRTLDGTAFMDGAILDDRGQRIPLGYDAEAIRWIQENLPGSPVVAEVNTAPLLYGWGNRYAVYTGNPAPVGWDWHERQQRGMVPGDAVQRRVTDIQRAYGTADPDEAYRIFARYDVRYFVVGGLERAYYPDGQAKWAAASGARWEQVYANPGVQIYRVNAPAAAQVGAR